MNDPQVRAVMVLAIFIHHTKKLSREEPVNVSPEVAALLATDRTNSLNSITEKLKDHGLHPLKKIDFMQVLESRATYSHLPAFHYMRANMEALELSESDIEELGLNTVLSSLGHSHKVGYFC